MLASPAAYLIARCRSQRQAPHIAPPVIPLCKKLTLTTQDVVHVLNAPSSCEVELAAPHGVAIKRAASGRSSFAIAFGVTQAQLDAASTKLAQACDGDAVLWIAYPKGTSKNYKCEFNRDSRWSVLGAAGFEPVRQVAIDEDWSALRFRSNVPSQD